MQGLGDLQNIAIATLFMAGMGGLLTALVLFANRKL